MTDMTDDAPEALYISFNTEAKIVRVLDNTIYPSRLSIRAEIDPHEDATEQVLAQVMGKIRFWFDSLVAKSIAFAFDNETALTMFIDGEGRNRTGNLIMITPGDPTDEVLAAVFQAKMTALANGMVEFGLVEVKSDNVVGLSFTFVGEGANVLPNMRDWIGERTYFSKPWWCRNDASTLDVIPPPEADLSQPPPWAFSLDPPDGARPESGIVVRPTFTPTVIDGGKRPEA